MCTEWTQELHANFMDAVTSLGQGRCFQKEILEMMNESSLTRMQVASQIQSKTQETGQSSGTRWESESPNNEVKMEHESTMTNNTPNHLRASSSSNPRRLPDEFFIFSDMDCL
ncbi:response regulator 10 [Perilla frutescens var. hirtella]|uniref:Response regulator 10 n=1 Tax=Perilla frutescens var. hirtella TaxID=608512 RepID=A0AAD4NY76_PERFH|nr:response regulator 10 [Perilla frutescens var. hirtella]